MQVISKKNNVVLLSIISNILLIIFKLIVGLVSGSVSIISEAIHSSLDLLAAIIAFFSIRISVKPPDKNHQYGHSKYENISGTIESLLIIIAVIWIIYEATIKIIYPQKIENIILCIIIMAISGIINLFVSKMLYKVAKEEDSVAIEADALHLKTDVYSSIGVALGLTIIYFTGWTFLDPFIAIAIAIYIAIEAYHLLIKAFSPLTDVSIEQNKLNDIINIIINNHNVCSIPHSIRSRKSGNKQFIDLHLEFNPAMTIYDVHKICDQIEDNINFDYPNTEIIIHPEVCDGNCDNCHYKKQMKNGNT